MFTIRVKSKNNIEQEVYIYGEQPLLSELEAENIIISHNCRQGHCGCCVLQLLQGDVIHNESLVPLSDDEILACQCKPATDITILVK